MTSPNDVRIAIGLYVLVSCVAVLLYDVSTDLELVGFAAWVGAAFVLGLVLNNPLHAFWCIAGFLFAFPLGYPEYEMYEPLPVALGALWTAIFAFGSFLIAWSLKRVVRLLRQI